MAGYWGMEGVAGLTLASFLKVLIAGFWYFWRSSDHGAKSCWAEVSKESRQHRVMQISMDDIRGLLSSEGLEQLLAAERGAARK